MQLAVALREILLGVSIYYIYIYIYIYVCVCVCVCVCVRVCNLQHPSHLNHSDAVVTEPTDTLKSVRIFLSKTSRYSKDYGYPEDSQVSPVYPSVTSNT